MKEVIIGDVVVQREGNFLSEVNIRPGGVERDPATGVMMGLKVHDNGIGVNGNSRFNGDVSINGVSQTTGRIVGLSNIVNGGTRDQNLRGVFERLNSFQTVGVTGIGANWGNNLTTFLGDPGIGAYATCQARRMSFSNQYQGHSIFSGIIEFVASDAWGTVRRGWLYSISPDGSIIWSGWRNV